MLVLTRKVGETIRIGENVTVRVLAMRGGQVSLGFTAPNEVRIFREEVLQSGDGESARVGAACRSVLDEPARAKATTEAVPTSRNGVDP